MDSNEFLKNAVLTETAQALKERLDKLDEKEKQRIVNLRDSEGNSALHFAAAHGLSETVELLLDAGAKPVALNKLGHTPLHMACARNMSNVVRIYRKRKITFWATTNELQTPLHWCARYNSSSCAKLLLKGDFGPYLGQQDIRGQTALHVACYNENYDMVELLLDDGTDSDILDHQGRTCLHLACLVGNANIVKLLFRHSADFNVHDHQGRNVLHYLMHSTHPEYMGVYKMLQKTQIRLPWETDARGYYPIHHAMHTNKVKAAKALLKWYSELSGGILFDVFAYATAMDPKGELFKYLITLKGSNLIPSCNPYGFTILHYACEFGQEKRVEILLEAGYSPNAASHNGFTPLHSAAMSGKTQVGELLLLEKVDIDAKSLKGLTPLHIACSQACIHFAHLLIVNGANVNARDEEGRTPMMVLAGESDGSEVIQLIDVMLEYDACINMTDKYGWTMMHYAASKGNTVLLQGLLERHADPTILDKCGRTVLHMACLFHRGLRMAQVLLKQTNNKLLLKRDNHGFMAVHYAAWTGSGELVVYLLKAMGTMQHLPSSGPPHKVNPLHLGVIRGKHSVVDAIVNFFQTTDLEGQNSCLTSRDALMRIPLHYAMKYGHDEMLPYLLPKEKCQLLLAWQDAEGVTPLALAAANGREKCIKYALTILGEKASTVKKIADVEHKRCPGMLAVTALGNGALSLVGQDNVERKDKKKRGLVHRAAFMGKNDHLKKMLCWAPKEANCKDINNVTPLHIASAAGNVEGVRILLDAGADPLAVDRKGATPGDWAATYGHMNVVDAFLERCEKEAGYFTEISICMAAKSGFAIVADSLLHKFPHLALCCDPKKRTPMHYFAENGVDGAITVLLNCNAQVDAVDEQGQTPLMAAAACSNGEDSIDVLVAAGADLKAKDVNNNTALHIACLHGHDDIAKTLLRHLIDADELQEVVGHVNNKQETILHLAVKKGMESFMKAILPLAGHLLFEMDSQGRIPLCAAQDDPGVVGAMMLVLGAHVEEEESLLASSNNASSRLSRSLNSTRKSPPPRRSQSPDDDSY